MVAEKLLDVANIAAGALIFGQFVTDRPFSVSAAAIGVVIWAGLLGCGIGLSRERP